VIGGGKSSFLDKPPVAPPDQRPLTFDRDYFPLKKRVNSRSGRIPPTGMPIPFSVEAKNLA
jgi:hypothetical protein